MRRDLPAPTSPRGTVPLTVDVVSRARIFDLVSVTEAAEAVMGLMAGDAGEGPCQEDAADRARSTAEARRVPDGVPLGDFEENQIPGQRLAKRALRECKAASHRTLLFPGPTL